MTDFVYYDEDAHVTYEPYTGPNGEVGFKAVAENGKTVYITLNPSSDGAGAPDHTPNVFLYIGETGDVCQDGAAHFYDLDEWLGEEPR